MTVMHPILLAEIESFLAETGMGETYFGKAAVGNSEVVSRLRSGGKVWPDTEARIRSFILTRRERRNKKRVSARADIQAPIPQKAGEASA